jgi:hypothetical protein
MSMQRANQLVEAGMWRLFEQALALAPEHSQARELLSASSKVQELGALVKGAKDLIALDDHSGALQLLGRVLALFPEHPEARMLKDKSEVSLLAQYESKVGPLHRRPKVVLQGDEIIWLNLDHRAGFLLSLMDGDVTLEDVYTLSGMERLDTSRLLAQLLEQNVIRVE